jgi:hypothetical protein
MQSGVIRHFNELPNDMRAGQEELIKLIWGARTNVKNERSVIQDEIKTEESAWQNTIYTTRA